MGVLERLKQKLGIASPDAGRHPIRVFLLEDDERRCEWFAKRFRADQLDIAGDVDQAKEMLAARTYDTIFLDPDLMPEHYGPETPDDERTGYANASCLASPPQLH